MLDMQTSAFRRKDEKPWMLGIPDWKTTIEVMFKSCIGGKQETVLPSVTLMYGGELTMCTEIKGDAVLFAWTTCDREWYLTEGPLGDA